MRLCRMRLKYLITPSSSQRWYSTLPGTEEYSTRDVVCAGVGYDVQYSRCTVLSRHYDAWQISRPQGIALALQWLLR
jgi:hypothetical protein